jgi:hypothetical protein
MRKHLTENRVIAWAAALSVAVWTMHSLLWWVHLEGDAPLYPILSLKVLEGRQYLMTEGQAHGGTLLIYLRAALFKLFGVSHFIGFFVNGAFVAAGVALWTRFAARYAGLTGALVTGTLAAIATERFARAACTDYFAFTALSSGLMLNLALDFARKPRVSARDAALAGALTGFSWYICRFSALYLLAAAGFYLAALPPERRALFVPSRRELFRGALNRLLAVATVVLAALSVVAFFTNDSFLGINAESNLKVAVALALATWLRHRFPVVLSALPRLAAAAGGFLVGYAPELLFKILVGTKDRATGLVRWRDLEPMLPEIPSRLGINFSFYYPLTLGLVSAACALALLCLGARRKGFLPVLAPVVLAFGAWVSIHTYMHLSPQYFFPVFLPAYLAAGFAVERSRFPRFALALSAIMLAVGVADLARNATEPNAIAEARVLERLHDWSARYGVTEGFGHMASNYNVMWAGKGWPFLMRSPLLGGDERFRGDQERVKNDARVFYLHQDSDREDLEVPPGYTVLEKASLGHGFDAFVLEKRNGT